MDSIQDQPTKSRIKVCIPERPRDYVPGSGPPLQPISLLPPKDSTAYILERIILPSSGLAADGTPLPRRMTYIVTWSDLPAAQMLVPAMDILDYVSPRELEEWEFKNTEEQMENEAIQKQQAQAGEAPKKRRGRPPKHSKIETAVVAPDEEETMVRGAMTIQTPAKDRLQDFEGLSDEDSTPVGTLQWETTGESATGESVGTQEQGFDDGSENFDNTPVAQSMLHPVSKNLFNGLPSLRPTLENKSSSQPSISQTPVPLPPQAFMTNSGKQKSVAAGEEPEAELDAEPEVEQADWEVKRIEDMEIYDVEGGQVRYFKVRWEGDWPPNQNPTWEPEDNLPAQLIRNYLKRGKRKRTESKTPKRPAAAQPAVAPSYPKKKSMKQTTLSWGVPAKQYKSVSEAFEGFEEDELGLPPPRETPVEEEQDDELFIVEEPPVKKSRMKTWIGNSLDLT
ncbi:uncharacterized protein FIESC28_04901 [Fusarium coffeatum]|uniref:Chromo domain-containing protein n=1 Tax=Fusarium coffeatum TaxID=231269 RepID=A0A366RWA0_9HYPO|nr:uncharacterized protein FIESC28_04901 [Fusarium coffeatum]RBR21364.1 hypothetical protein FIESC28_04901 [Fusarium coffeatum]